ncbi:MAG: Gfo/Idh/MocA family protein [Planctomycetota bacterium]
MTQSNRREFLEQSLLTAAAAVTLPGMTGAVLAQDAARPAKRSDVLRVGVVGVRGRGRGHIGAFKKSPDAEVVAICDPDSGVIGPAVEAVPNATYYEDIRRLLDDPTIDVISIATPNHWHALATIWALQAGKHVYVEKPISHNVAEGRAVVNAARRYGRLVQHGTQARSNVATRDAIAWLRAGGLGRVTRARGLCYKRRQSIGRVDGPQPPPATLDMDLWTGPARLEPLMRAELHYDWHWVFNTGNGDIGNQGVHQMDIARWGLGLDDFPQRIRSCGGRVGYVDDGETPNSQLVTYDYGEKQIIFEVRGLATDPYRTASIGVVFHGERGYMVSSSYAKVVVFDHDGNETKTFTGGGDHVQNFLDAIKQGRGDLLNADALEGHRSSALCHLGNISHRLGAVRRLSDLDAPFESDPANRAFDEFRSHLTSNGLPADRTDIAVGPSLAFDDASERFHGPGAVQANALLSREYRAPYAIPDELT